MGVLIGQGSTHTPVLSCRIDVYVLDTIDIGIQSPRPRRLKEDEIKGLGAGEGFLKKFSLSNVDSFVFRFLLREIQIARHILCVV